MIRAFLRKHAATFVVATVAAMVAAGGVSLAHDADGGGHDKFAHKAGTAQKANKLSVVVIKRSALGSVGAGNNQAIEVKCPAGQFAVGGGMAGVVNGVSVLHSYPSDGTGSFAAGHSAWTVSVNNASGITRTYRAYVACVKAAKLNSNYSAGDPAG